jgi:transposase-like protein
LKSLIATQIAAIFNAESRPHAEERLRVFLQAWRDKQPRLVAWAEENIPESFAVCDLPEAHRRARRNLRSVGTRKILHQTTKLTDTKKSINLMP